MVVFQFQGQRYEASVSDEYLLDVLEVAMPTTQAEADAALQRIDADDEWIEAILESGLAQWLNR